MNKAQEKQGKATLKAFRKYLKAETNDAKKAYERSKKHYELTLKKFIRREVTGKDFFNVTYESAKDGLWDIYSADLEMLLSEEMILDQMIYDFEYWLEEGQFEQDETIN